jgi:FHS family L-fucose permease-like MFS transporter
VKFVYITIALVVIVVALFFFKTTMPEIKEEEWVTEKDEYKSKSLFQHSHFVWAVVAQFFYVATQVGIAALFINYCTEKHLGITNEKAAYLFSGCLVLFTVGRFVGTAIMKKVAPAHLLAIYAAVNILLCILVVFLNGMLSVYALMAIFFFESVMFPTIFALGVKNLGQHTKKGASFIIMAIAGGAIMPYIMGAIAEAYTTATAYMVPLICFGVVLFFALVGYKIKPQV